MPGTILWLDNDLRYLTDYVEVLKENGYAVEVVTTVSEAEAALHSRRYVLAILDVMLPTKTEAEEALYPPELTDKGHRTGLAVFRRWRATLEANETAVLVLTVRLDDDICKEFAAAGLAADNFATKLSLADVSAFAAKVRELVEASDSRAKGVRS